MSMVIKMNAIIAFDMLDFIFLTLWWLSFVPKPA